MTEKILLGVLIVAFLLMSSFLVAASVTTSVPKAISENHGSLKLVLSEPIIEENEEDEANEPEDVPIIGNALDQASAAALDFVGEGRVTDSEIGDEEGYYEIEVTLDNGHEIDVHLDSNFNVLSYEADGVGDDD